MVAGLGSVFMPPKKLFKGGVAMKLEIFTYNRNYQSYFNPYFYKKFRTVEAVKTDFGLVKIYELNNIYLAILFTDGVVYDGLTVLKQKERDGYYGIGYIDEVGNFELIETSKEKLLKKLKNLRRYEDKIIKDITYPPVKTENIDPLEPSDYWNTKELFYNKIGIEPKKILRIVLENGRFWKQGIIDVFVIQRKDRDNKDLLVAYGYAEPQEKDEVIEIYGKLGETYILKPYTGRQFCDEKEAIRLINAIKEDYEKADFEVLDEEGYELLDKIKNV
jgi:hypothetical protein